MHRLNPRSALLDVPQRRHLLLRQSSPRWHVRIALQPQRGRVLHAETVALDVDVHAVLAWRCEAAALAEAAFLALAALLFMVALALALRFAIDAARHVPRRLLNARLDAA